MITYKNTSYATIVGMGLLLGSALSVEAQPSETNPSRRGDDIICSCGYPGSDHDELGLPADHIRNPNDQSETILLNGARIYYEVSGGLAAVKNRLRVYDTGAITYDASHVADPTGLDLRAAVSENEVYALKLAFLFGGFEDMPARFHDPGHVQDGVDVIIAARLADGSVKVVRSSTGAEETLTFTRLLSSLDRIIEDLRNTEVLNLKTYQADGTERVFRMKADGQYRIELTYRGRPLQWEEGQLTSEERRMIQSDLEAYDFESSRLCTGDSSTDTSHELRARIDGRDVALGFSAGNTDPELQPIQDIVGMVGQLDR